MNAILLLVLLSILFTSLFVIIPKFAPANLQDTVKNWLGMGFSGLLLLLALIQSKFADPTMLTPVLFYIFVLGFCLSGVYWWIPAYVKKEEQSDAIKYMFLSVTFAIIIVNNMSPSMGVTMGGRRR
jgi:FtsH-binding integral membrane protein